MNTEQQPCIRMELNKKVRKKFTLSVLDGLGDIKEIA